MKRAAKIFGIAAAVLLVVALAVPFLVDANRFRPLLQTKLSEALGREVTLGSLQLSILSGAVAANDLAIADDPAFSKTPFVRAKSLAIGVELLPLIFSRKLNVTGIAIQAPEIDLIQTPEGVWNFSSLGAKPAPPAPAPSASGAPDLSVDLVKISDGRFTLAKVGAAAKPLVLDKVNLQVTDFSTTSSFPFSLAANMTGGGEMKLDGKAGPINAGDAASTPFEANLHVTHLDVVLSGILDASLGVAGLVSIEGSANSNNSAVTIIGKLKVDQLKLVKGGLPAKPTAEFDIAMTHDLKKQTGTLSHASIHLGKDVATLAGAYSLQGDKPVVHLKLSGHGLAVTELAAFLPALAVVLPAGSSIDQGTAAVDVTADGPLNKLVEAGTVDLENTRLAHYDFASKMKVLDALAGIKAEPDTQIQTFSAKVRASPDGLQVQDLNLVVPSIGDITGAGTVSPEQALDFKMRVALHSSMASVAAVGSKGGIPFTITGTSSDPSFKPDMKGLVTDKLKDVTGVFGKKKKHQ
jgi:AsmA protein